MITIIAAIAGLVLYGPVLDDPNYVVGAGADAASLVTVGRSLVAVHDWTFLLGAGLLGPGVGNGLLLGYLMYRSGLVPQPMAVLGLVGGPLLVASGTATLFGFWEQPVAVVVACLVR